MHSTAMHMRSRSPGRSVLVKFPFSNVCCLVQAYRRALRRPLPAERNYLAAQFVGVGIQFGDLDRTMRGRMVEGPLGGSPAEAAGNIMHRPGPPVQGHLT